MGRPLHWSSHQGTSCFSFSVPCTLLPWQCEPPSRGANKGLSYLHIPYLHKYLFHGELISVCCSQKGIWRSCILFTLWHLNWSYMASVASWWERNVHNTSCFIRTLFYWNLRKVSHSMLRSLIWLLCRNIELCATNSGQSASGNKTCILNNIAWPPPSGPSGIIPITTHQQDYQGKCNYLSFRHNLACW